MSSATNTSLEMDNDELAATAFKLITQGEQEREKAALILQSCFDTWLIARFKIEHGMSEADAEEMTREVWIKVFKKFESDPGYKVNSPGGWIFKVAANVAIDFHRRKTTGKRGGGKTEVQLEDEQWAELSEPQTMGAVLSRWTRFSISRQFEEWVGVRVSQGV